MKEKKIISLIVVISILLSLVGVFSVFANGWINFKNTEKVSFLKNLPELLGFNQEKTYLLLFQNNLELRPSGGYLGSFGIIKFKNAKITNLKIHDTNIFDGFGKEQTQAPQPLKDYLKINNWQMRDANWSPDYLISAKQIEKFYHLQGGKENFDGIIAVNVTILPRILGVIGPIHLTGFDKEFNSENVLRELEYEIEKNYLNRGIEAGERKTILKALVKKLIAELIDKKYLTDPSLKNIALEELAKKNILLYFKSEKIQEFVEDKKWGGRIDNDYSKNYLMINEANLAAKKSNAFIQRQINYQIDYTNSKPKVNLKIKFIHSNPEKDWFNDDYKCYLRVYLPAGSWVVKSSGLKNGPNFSKDLGKTVFAGYFTVLAGQTKEISLTYLLPEEIKDKDLFIQKQSGIDSFKASFLVKNEIGQESQLNKTIWQDKIIQLP